MSRSLGDWPVVPVVAGVAALAGSYAAVGFTPRFVVAPLVDAAVAGAPDLLVAWSIQTLGDWGQRLLVAGVVAATAALFAGVVAVGTALGRRVEPVRPTQTVFAGAATLATAGFLSGSAVSAVGAGLAAALVVAVAATGRTDESASRARRRVIRGVGVAAATLGLGIGTDLLGGDAVGGRAGGGNDPVERDPVAAELLDVAASRRLDVDAPELEPLVSEEFYEVDISTPNPRVEREGWHLRVTGKVDSPLILDFESLASRPAEHRFATLRCVGDPLNGHKMDTALWTGTPIAPLLAEAGAPETCCVMLRAVDGYYEEFPRSALEDGFLAWGMNGRPLPRAHGAPVRALIPGHWGEINVKWIDEIEVLDAPEKGYWEKRGWHGTGPVEPVAKLHHVATGDGVELAGHAYAGTRGVSRVEVSTDGGDSWAEAELSDPLPGATPADADPDAVEPTGEAADAWRMWRYAYDADERHQVVVRMVDGDGTVQPKAPREPYPRGAAGWVEKTVRP